MEHAEPFCGGLPFWIQSKQLEPAPDKKPRASTPTSLVPSERDQKLDQTHFKRRLLALLIPEAVMDLLAGVRQ